MSEPVKIDVLAIGAHPDDVELCCGGTLAVLAQAGRRTAILHLTRGEAGTRGTPEEREREARAAAAALGAAAVDFLNCGDGGLRTGRDEEDAVIARLRLWRPEIVLGPSPVDRHPDHARGWRLVEAACFYAGLARRGTGQPHRPSVLLAYMQHDPFDPTLIVDVTSGWEAKMTALDCYESQIHTPRGRERQPPPAERSTSPGRERHEAWTAGAVGTPLAAPAGYGAEPGSAPVSPGGASPRNRAAAAGTPATTRVSTPEFRASIEGRARHYGLVIGTELGEPYWSRLPLAVPDLMALVLPGALR